MRFDIDLACYWLMTDSHLHTQSSANQSNLNWRLTNIKVNCSPLGFLWKCFLLRCWYKNYDIKICQSHLKSIQKLHFHTFLAFTASLILRHRNPRLKNCKFPWVVSTVLTNTSVKPPIQDHGAFPIMFNVIFKYSPNISRNVYLLKITKGSIVFKVFLWWPVKNVCFLQLAYFKGSSCGLTQLSYSIK